MSWMASFIINGASQKSCGSILRKSFFFNVSGWLQFNWLLPVIPSRRFHFKWSCSHSQSSCDSHEQWIGLPCGRRQKGFLIKIMNVFDMMRLFMSEGCIHLLRLVIFDFSDPFVRFSVWRNFFLTIRCQNFLDHFLGPDVTNGELFSIQKLTSITNNPQIHNHWG